MSQAKATRVGICFNDYEQFWWRADEPSQAHCPVCSTDDEDYAEQHRFFVAESVEQAQEPKP